ncbi:uncharacterized protein HMPREF1541_06918 [Cyphellophora europaea CBS 101466]|uniref:Heterokaryon incompatibility domain-containing protein n=1 Tax=Cyphellophora europaea (strain CBS 101466) TaxID=1220924 RepID=W2RR09_CYPE1|nr:uncharacterized protein HMPREF1541_06918 [Cyphellophora europaea CBS 101466]ETN38877.1 hypothetical protein HMPREF1541_06918 [Cyphellophora europaea CBS 101466]
MAFSQYRSLDKTQQEIRILTLYAGAEGTSIACSIEQTHLAEAGEFAALSYCWGPAGDEAEIVVNDEPIFVRKNLWKFVASLRHLYGTMRLWIDYICINQRDEEERGHQVKLMASIFSAASDVYAWLGDATPETAVALQFIDAVLPFTCSQYKEAFDRDYLRSGIRALRTLIDREYWTRLWIIQEVTLARNLWLVVGATAIPWVDLQRAVTAKVAPRNKNATAIEAFRKIRKTRQRRFRTIPLNRLIQDFHTAGCHNPRDRIFGLLGLLDEHGQSCAVVDYRLSIFNVCLANMKFILATAGPHRSEPYIVWKTVQGIYNGDYTELHRLMNDQVLRSQLNIGIAMELFAFRGGAKGELVSYHTFAALDDQHSSIVLLTPENENSHFKAYLTNVRRDERSVMLYSTTHSREWSVVLNARGLGLAVKKNGDAYTVLEIVGDGAYTCHDKLIMRYGIESWLQGRIPDSDCQIIGHESEPSQLKRRYGPGWHVYLNGAAVVEAMRNHWYLCSLSRCPQAPSVPYDFTAPPPESWRNVDATLT